MDPASGEKKRVTVEAIGGNGGVKWDDGIYHGVREITLYYQNCVEWIQVVYDENGEPVPAPRRGDGPSSADALEAKITLQFPDEFLIRVRGYYGHDKGETVIKSLSFQSNRKRFGPFGPEQGTPFSLSLDGVDVVGFKGSSGWYLDAIGFHLAMKEPTKSLESV